MATKKKEESHAIIETHRPVSRQDEATYLGYYGYPYYWGVYPMGLADPSASFKNDLLADKTQRVNGFTYALHTSRHWISH